MATLFYDESFADHMRAQFKHHAEAGRKYMLAIESGGLAAPITPAAPITNVRLFTKAVDHLQDITPLLQSLSACQNNPDYALRAVFDLGKDYDTQREQALNVHALLEPALGDCFDRHGRLKPGPLISLY